MAASPLLDVDLRLRLGPTAMELTLRSARRAVALVGPSGAGKTTFLRALAGLERGARGRVAVAGEVWQDEAGRFLPPWRRGLGLVPQDACLFPHRTVRDNLAWTRPTSGELERVAGMLGLGALLARRPRHLSGGERQRVALGRALLARPRLLLLDEPLAALDRPARAEIAARVAAEARALGALVVLVSHDQADVAALADEVFPITGGRVLPPASEIDN